MMKRATRNRLDRVHRSAERLVLEAANGTAYLHDAGDAFPSRRVRRLAQRKAARDARKARQ